MKTYVTIYRNFTNKTDGTFFLGRQGFVEHHLQLQPNELIHAVSYFIDGPRTHEYMVEVYVDQLLEAATDTFPSAGVADAVMDMVSENIIMQVVQQEIVHCLRLSGADRPSNMFLVDAVDAAMAFVFGKTVDSKTRSKHRKDTLKKYVS